jgi:hypothetical protein
MGSIATVSFAVPVEMAKKLKAKAGGRGVSEFLRGLLEKSL